MTVGDVVEVKGPSCHAGHMDEIAEVKETGFILKDLPDVLFPEEMLIHYETGYMKVGYFPANTHIISFSAEQSSEKIWAADGYLYWAALTDLEEYFRGLCYDERGTIPPREVKERFYEILLSNKVDLTKVE